MAINRKYMRRVRERSGADSACELLAYSSFQNNSCQAAVLNMADSPLSAVWIEM